MHVHTYLRTYRHISDAIRSGHLGHLGHFLCESIWVSPPHVYIPDLDQNYLVICISISCTYIENCNEKIDLSNRTDTNISRISEYFSIENIIR